MSKLRDRLSASATGVRVLAASGVVRPYGPRTLVRLTRTLLEWGACPAGGLASLAMRAPNRVGLVDELGSLTFRQLHERSNALAWALRARGVGEGDGVAVMCRNHRYLVEVMVAVGKLGADVFFLNTAFPSPQVADVIAREKPRLVVFDQEFSDLLTDAGVRERLVAWTDGDGVVEGATLESLIAESSTADLAPPQRHGRIVILTSGTTGVPRGAPRSEAGIDAAVALLSRMPFRYGWTVHIVAPMFHSWGLAHLMLGMLLGSTVVLQRRFDPEQCLTVTEAEKCDAMVVIPVMLQRILRLPEETLASYDLSAVKVVASSGSALPGDLATEWMDRFGENLYNTYGSTEVAYASIATPADLRAAPGTAGRPPASTVVRILDEHGNPLPQGECGRIFVGNGMLLAGYTDGGSKEVVDGLMSSGDVGRFDTSGRLFVEGRDDEMIVSGGENVFPQEVEDCLLRHPKVQDAAAIGIDDDEFGARLRAFVVLVDSPASPDVAAEDELRQWVKSNLARYKVPRDFVFLEELPRNATGKVLKRELRAWQD